MFIDYLSNQNQIFPPNLGEFIPQDARVRLVSSIVDKIDVSPVVSTYCNAEGGRPAYNPVMLLKVTLFGYMNNIFSSRVLEQELTRNVHFMWLSGYSLPSDTTLERFKSRCAPYIKSIFSGLVSVLVEMGEVELSEDLYIDGTTVRSRAARRRIKWRSTASRFSQKAAEDIQQGIADLLERIDEGDATGYDLEQGTSLTTDDARDIALRIEAKAAEQGLRVKGKVRSVLDACDRKDTHDSTLEACGGRCGTSPTDPDCAICHAKEDGYDGKPSPNYNVQIATQNQYVTNFEAYASPDDMSVAMEFVKTCVEENGVAPRAVMGDAGYGCEELFDGLEQMGVEAVVKYRGYDAEQRRRPAAPGQYDGHGFVLSGDGKALVCPAGHLMRAVKVEQACTRNGFKSDCTTFACDHCGGCPFHSQCDVTNSGGTIKRKMGNLREIAKARARLAKPENQERIKRRSVEPEPVFGNVKYNHGYTRFRHFGKPKVRMDLGFLFMALNLLKLCKSTAKRA